eukprot:2560510-Heterocapsa_arctica.AAC.1
MGVGCCGRRDMPFMGCYGATGAPHLGRHRIGVQAVLGRHGRQRVAESDGQRPHLRDRRLLGKPGDERD